MFKFCEEKMIRSLEANIKDFWNFAKDYKKIANIEDVFLDWSKTADLDILTFKKVYENITETVSNLFGDKIANFDVTWSDGTTFRNITIKEYERLLRAKKQQDSSIVPVTPVPGVNNINSENISNQSEFNPNDNQLSDQENSQLNLQPQANNINAAEFSQPTTQNESPTTSEVTPDSNSSKQEFENGILSFIGKK
jgi:hypothetical protein